jgi:ABC-type transport system substrate-binding protein
MVPPGNQVTMMWQTLQSGTGPLKPMYEMLIGEDPFTGSWTDKGLAQEWSVAPGAKDWTFRLRQGVPFHSTDSWAGGEFTTKDIEGSIATLVREDALSTTSIWTNLGAQKPEALDIQDDYNFTWRLTKGEPLFESYASSGWVATMLSQDYMDAVGIEGYQDHPIGTGPFRFIELVIDSHISYERVDGHWRQTPHFPELKFFYVREDSTRLAMQLTEETHIADIPAVLIPNALERGQVVSVGTLPGFFLYIWIGGLFYGEEVPIRVGERTGELREIAPGYDADDPLRDVRVREALNIAVNRELLNQTFWDGDAIPQLIHGFPPTHPDFKHDDWTPYPFDPDRARELLAEAGYPDGFEFDFQTSIVSGVPEAPDVAEAVTSMWQAIGLKPNLLPIDYGTMRSEMRARDVGRTVGTFRQGAGPGGIYTRGNIQYRLGPVPGGAGNGLWEIPALDDIWIDLAAAVEAEDILRETYRIGDYLYENYITVPLFFLFPKAVVNPNFVQEYRQNMLHFGPAVNHEYTMPVYK